eukprot:Opistho-1_new@88377
MRVVCVCVCAEVSWCCVCAHWQCVCSRACVRMEVCGMSPRVCAIAVLADACGLACRRKRKEAPQLNSMHSESQRKSEAHNDVEIKELKASASGVRGSTASASSGAGTDDESWRPAP